MKVKHLLAEFSTYNPEADLVFSTREGVGRILSIYSENSDEPTAKDKKIFVDIGDEPEW